MLRTSEQPASVKALDTSLPNFLGIGAARSATTLLYHVLKAHPDVWLPPKKELHYFDRDPAYCSPSFLAADESWRRFLGRGDGPQRFRRNFFRQVGHQILRRDMQTARWLLRFYLGDNSTGWYTSLFEGVTVRVAGEITPAYALLGPDEVRQVHNIMPGGKIIFIIRNPIERTWSQARKGGVAAAYLKGQLSESDLRAWVRSATVALRNDYLRTIDTWRHFFPASQFLLLQFDELEHDPARFLARISRFLDIASFAPRRTERVNATPNRSDCPEAVARLFAGELLQQLEAIADRLGGYTRNWRDRARSLVSGAPDDGAGSPVR